MIRYGLYNVGDTVASDIVLTEAGFGTDDFDVAGTVLIYIFAYCYVFCFKDRIPSG